MPTQMEKLYKRRYDKSFFLLKAIENKNAPLGAIYQHVVRIANVIGSQ